MFVLTNWWTGNILKKSKDLTIFKSDFKKIKRIFVFRKFVFRRFVFHRIIFLTGRGKGYASKRQQLREQLNCTRKFIKSIRGRLIVWKRITNLVKGNAGLQAVS